MRSDCRDFARSARAVLCRRLENPEQTHIPCTLNAASSLSKREERCATSINKKLFTDERMFAAEHDDAHFNRSSTSILAARSSA